MVRAFARRTSTASSPMGENSGDLGGIETAYADLSPPITRAHGPAPGDRRLTGAQRSSSLCPGLRDYGAMACSATGS